MTRFAIFLLIMLYGAAHAQQPSKEIQSQGKILFTLKNAPVYTDEFVYLFKKNHPKRDDYTEAKISEYLNLLINFKLKVTEAQHRGLDTTRAFVKEFATYKAELKKPYLAGSDDLDRLTKEVYDRMSVELLASHILITLKPEASPADTLAAFSKIETIRKRALGGESFDSLAKEFSEDPSARTNGGNLGYFSAMQMVYPFEEAAYHTRPGEISKIIRTRFGYHIIKVMASRPAQGEVEISHILIRAGKGNDAKIKNTIFEIYDQLKAGRKWEELCKEFSEDTNTKNSGGRLRPFGTGAFAAIPEFERVAFSLKSSGEYSDPFQSNYGWHIIRLEKKIPLQPYKDIESALKKRVARDERAAASQALALEKKKKLYGYWEDSQIKVKLLAMADSSLIRGNWQFQGSDSLLNSVLFRLNTDQFKIRDFVKFVSSRQTRSNLSPSSYMHQLYDRQVDEAVNDMEEHRLMRDNTDYRMLSTEYREGILLFEIMEKEVWNKASEDSLGQRKYYQDHLTQFKAGNRLEARVLSTQDKAFFEEMKGKMNAGDTIRESDIKKFKSVVNWKVYEREESQIIDQISWIPGLQGTELKGTYYLVEVRRLVPPGTKSFDEARAGVISGYQDFLEKKWLQQLKQKYPVSVNKKHKQAVIAELRK